MDLRGKPLNLSKQLKEEFVSNLNGSSLIEIAALSTIVPALVVLRQWGCSRVVNGRSYSSKATGTKDKNVASCIDWKSYTVGSTIDFFSVFLPILLFFTVLAEWAYLGAIILMFLLLSCILRTSQSHFEGGYKHLSSIRAIVLSYRVSVVLVTCICILAVDFNIFPRRYAKTETYGTSLMDLGVGSFVVANALVSRQARNVMSRRWKAAFLSSSPLLFLGFGRLISTRGVDYQVHVGEYGVHWNFFFTLAAVSILSSIISIHPKYCGICGLLILIGYQACLVSGLNEYLVSNVRALDIISQNKEGIFSIFGYWGMYLLGVYIGYTVFFGKEALKKADNFWWARVRVWFLSLFFWLLTIVLDNLVERVSRRMCNLAYVTFVLAQNFQVLSVIMLSDFVHGGKPLMLEEAFNQNLLGSFLLANVLTGVVNLYVDTLSASPLSAFGILFAYAFVLSAVVGFAGFHGIRFKFW